MNAVNNTKGPKGLHSNSNTAHFLICSQAILFTVPASQTKRRGEMIGLQAEVLFVLRLTDIFIFAFF